MTHAIPRLIRPAGPKCWSGRKVQCRQGPAPAKHVSGQHRGGGLNFVDIYKPLGALPGELPSGLGGRAPAWVEGSGSRASPTRSGRPRVDIWRGRPRRPIAEAR